MFEDATSPEFASMMAGTQALPWEQQEGHPLNRMDNAAARTFIMSLLKCVGHYPIIFSETAYWLCASAMSLRDRDAAAGQSNPANLLMAASSSPASCLCLSLLFFEALRRRAVDTHQDIDVHVRPGRVQHIPLSHVCAGPGGAAVSHQTGTYLPSQEGVR